MTRIDAAAALNALLKSRPEMGEGASSAASGARGVKRQDERVAKARSENAANSYLEPQLLQRVRAIAQDDPQRRRKAFRLFMESVLLSQLGRSLLGEPEFNQLVETVVRQIEEDTGLRESSLLAADFLIERSAEIK